MKKFALHPGHIISKNDGDKHYISARKLAILYELKPFEYIVCDPQRPETLKGLDMDKYYHLYPRSDGKYGRPL